MKTEQLGSFIDRQTFRWERTYPHPIERVWRAITVPEEVSRWMGPTSFELREGTTAKTVWGEPTVSAVKPPNLLELTNPDGMGHVRFELERVADATTLVRLVVWFHPDCPIDPDQDAHEGWDQPGGPGSPWRPGFMAGFHAFLAKLERWLDGEDVHFVPNDPDWEWALPAYRELVRETIPGGVQR